MTTAVLLAAGQSRRFGSACKLQALFRGKPLVRHAADAIIMAEFPAIAVVTNPAVAELLPEFRVVQGGDAQSQSLQAGLQQITDWPALIVLGDMPFVDGDLLRRVATAPCPAAATDGALICPPACIPKTLRPAMMNLTGDRGAGAFLRHLSGLHQVLVSPRTLKDIDIVDDFI